MFGGMFRAEHACQPDLSSSDSWPRRVEDLAQHLSTTLSRAAFERTAKSNKEVRTCLQATISAVKAETAASCSEQSKLLRSLLATDLPAQMLTVLPALEFEAQKDIMRLFHQFLQAGSVAVTNYVCSHREVLQILLDGCGNSEVALHCHMFIRSCARFPDLVVCMLDAGYATRLLELAQHQIFDIASDAFSSLRELLLAHRQLAAAYLEENFKTFFAPYNKLLESADYVTKRQALRLLGEILLERHHKRVRCLYVGEGQFLQVQMNLLRDNSRAIQMDAFHVFKLFAACPNKSPRVHQILLKNRERLVRLLELLVKDDDEEFLQDQSSVIEALWMLEGYSPSKNS